MEQNAGDARDWPLEQFDASADAHTLKHSWQEWLEAFELVMEMKGVFTQRERFVLLLMRGGKAVRQIFNNLMPCEEEVTVLTPPRLIIPEYDNAVVRLNKYFQSKINTRMELERFRDMKQGKFEDFARYLLRLRAQANRCEFKSRTEEEILYQATRGAVDAKVGNKRIDVNMTLDQLTQYAIGLEILNEQKKLDEISMSQQVTSANHNNVDDNSVLSVQKYNRPLPVKRNRSIEENPHRTDRRFKPNECDGCGSWHHRSGDRSCRALKMSCFKCGRSGHMAVKCSRNLEKRSVNRVVSGDDWEDQTPKPRELENINKVMRC